MARAPRSTTPCAVVICLLSAQWSGLLFASEPSHPPTETAAPSPTAGTTAPSTALPIDFRTGPTDASAAAAPPAAARSMFDAPSVSTAWEPLPAHAFTVPGPAFAVGGQIYQGAPYRLRHDGSIAALMVGAAAAIAGTAVLVYANRPECSTNQFAGGCGYGTKVVGSAVLAGGIVGLFVGALTW